MTKLTLEIGPVGNDTRLLTESGENILPQLCAKRIEVLDTVPHELTQIRITSFVERVEVKLASEHAIIFESDEAEAQN